MRQASGRRKSRAWGRSGFLQFHLAGASHEHGHVARLDAIPCLMSNRAADASVLGIRSFTLVVRCIVRYRRLFFWDGCCSRRRTMRILGRVALVRMLTTRRASTGRHVHCSSLPRQHQGCTDLSVLRVTYRGLCPRHVPANGLHSLIEIPGGSEAMNALAFGVG